MIRRAAAAVATLLAAALLSTDAAPAAAAAKPPTDLKNVLPIWDGGDQWVFCEDLKHYTGDLDYGVGDPPRSTWAAWVKQLDRCWGRKHIVHIRYNHEINGTWFPWSYKTPAQFRRDFADFKAFVKRHSKHAISINFGLALNYGNHRAKLDDWWTPAADYVAVSIYESPWIQQIGWSAFRKNVIGPDYWHAWSKRHNRRLAFGEWGSLTPQWQRHMRSWGASNGLLYAAYLHCGNDDCPWIRYV